VPAESRARVEVHRIAVSDWPVFRQLRLAALAEAPQAFGTKLADWQGTGDSPDRWMQRLRAVPANFIAHLDGAAVGLASGALEAGGAAELISFWVAPGARGAGVSDALIDAVVAWAAAEGRHPLTLQVKIDNQHARAAYRRCGFREADDRSADSSDELVMVRPE
jgi:ribosomal protein S18 acetylase RimI-like enzyme